MKTNEQINNDFISEEYKTLDPQRISFCIDDTRFICITDKTFDKPHSLPPLKQLDHLHFHSYYELFFVKKGPLIIRLESDQITLRDGDLILIRPHTMHRSVINDVCDVARYNVNFYAEKINCVSDVSLFSLIEQNFNEPYSVFNSLSSVESLFVRLGECLKSGNRLSFSAFFHELIVTILSSSPLPTLRGMPFGDSHESRIYKIHAIVNQHYMNDISADDIAKMLFLSTRQVSRIIRKHNGCTFGELITNLRLDASVNFLTTTNMRILDIATTVGYNSLSCFYSAFKRRYGCLPLTYRKKHTIK